MTLNIATNWYGDWQPLRLTEALPVEVPRYEDLVQAELRSINLDAALLVNVQQTPLNTAADWQQLLGGSSATP